MPVPARIGGRASGAPSHSNPALSGFPLHGLIPPEGPAVTHWSWPRRSRVCPHPSLSGLIRGVGLDTLMSTAAAAGANVDGFVWDVLNSLHGPAGSARFEAWFGVGVESAGGVEGAPSGWTVGWARGALDRLYNEALGPGVAAEPGPAGREAEREAEMHDHKPPSGYRSPPGRARGLRWDPVKKCPTDPRLPWWWPIPGSVYIPEVEEYHPGEYEPESEEDYPLQAVFEDVPFTVVPGVWLPPVPESTGRVVG